MNRKVVGSVTEEEKTQFKSSLSVGTVSMNLRKFSQKTMLNYMSVLSRTSERLAQNSRIGGMKCPLNTNGKVLRTGHGK